MFINFTYYLLDLFESNSRNVDKQNVYMAQKGMVGDGAYQAWLINDQAYTFENIRSTSSYGNQ